MKKLIKILLGVVCVFILAIIAIFYFTADIVASADEFFLAVKQNDIDKAYSYLSEDFQISTSKTDLEDFLAKNLISKYVQAVCLYNSFHTQRRFIC